MVVGEWTKHLHSDIKLEWPGSLRTTEYLLTDKAEAALDWMHNARQLRPS
jgi:hypothetical protein